MQALRVYSADVPNIKLDLDTEVLFSHCKSCGSLTYIWPCVLTEEYHLRVDILFSQHYAHQNAQTHNSEQQRSVTTGHIRHKLRSVLFSDFLVCLNLWILHGVSMHFIKSLNSEIRGTNHVYSFSISRLFHLACKWCYSPPLYLPSLQITGLPSV